MSTYGNMIGTPMGLLDDLDRRVTNLENIITAPSNAPGQLVVPVPPNSPPGTLPVIIAPIVSPPTDVFIKTGALYGNIYADVIWLAPLDDSAVSFEIAWAIKNADGSLGLPGAARVGGNQYRINNLLPNTTYEVTVSSVNILGQMARYPIDGSFVVFATGTDQTIPPAVTNVVLAQGATSVIVTFSPLTFQQAPDVANGDGVYQIDISNDSAFGTLFRTVRTTAFVVAFNDIYPHTTLASAITLGAGTGTPVQLVSTTGFPTSNYNAMVDQETITFAPAGGTNVTIVARNQGKNAPGYGPVAHVIGAPVSIQTATTWYARVAAIDNSGNQGPWAYSGQPLSGQGVVDQMIVGDLSAAHITFGTMKGDRIETNTLSANSITSSYISSANIQLAGGSFYAGFPPQTGLIINSQGLRLYDNGVLSVALDTYSGTGYFSGTISASTISGTTISGGAINGANINGNTITGGTINATNINGGTITGVTITGSTISGNTVTGQSISGGTITGATINSSTINVGNINTTNINGSTYSAGSVRDIIMNVNSANTDTSMNLNSVARIGVFNGLLSHPAVGLLMDVTPGDVYIGGNTADIALVCNSTTVLAGTSGTGNLFVNGTFTAGGTKSFRIPHPVPSQKTKDLLYFTTESPKSELIYRGKATTQNNTATIDLDRYFKCTIATFDMLTKKKNRQVFLFNETSSGRVFYTLTHGVLVITSENLSDTVGWLVVAERADKNAMSSNVVDYNGDFLNELPTRPSLLASGL